MSSAAASLLDFNAPFDVERLDQIVTHFYATYDKQAESDLIQLQQHPLAWMRVDTILEKSNNLATRMIALKILNDTVDTKWAILPAQQKEGIKSFLVGAVIKWSSNGAADPATQQLLNSLNIALVHVVKQEWPHNWPTFISDLVQSSKRSTSLCANNMAILSLISEEIFDYSSNTMTTDKMANMKKSLNEQFAMIHQLCEAVLTGVTDIPLLSQTLATLKRFLHWIPVGYIFETQLIPLLALKFFPATQFQNVTLECLIEIGSVKLRPDEEANYQSKLIVLFHAVISQSNQRLIAESDIAAAHATGNSTVQDFIFSLTVFITTFLQLHLEVFESNSDNSRQLLLQSLQLLLRLSQVEELVIFKIALEFWQFLVAELYTAHRVPLTTRNNLTQGGGGTGHQGGLTLPPLPPRLLMYSPILSALRIVLVSRMAKPEEVLIIEDENGQIVKETLKDSDSVVLYKSMREALVYLTHLDPLDAQQQMLHKLNNQVNGSEWSWKNLNTLCWAIGSISGALQPKAEKDFLVKVIRDLLHLVEIKHGKEHKAVIASNIMYVVGQYPRFLKEHWKFLKTVVNKLFEFMHEPHPGVQDMSVDTFLKIATKCKKKFVLPPPQTEERESPFIQEILTNLKTTIGDLEPQQVHVFYEACGFIIGAEPVQETQQKYIFTLMDPPNTVWTTIITQATNNTASLIEPETVKKLVMVLKMNSRVATSLGEAYIFQLSRLYVEMLAVYKVYSGVVSSRVQQNGPNAVRFAEVKNMRAVKREVLNLVRTFIQHSAVSSRPLIVSQFVVHLLDPVLDDYRRCVPDAREVEVIGLFDELISKLGDAMAPHVNHIFEAVFLVTLDMINKDVSSYPDHRLALYGLLRALITHCLTPILSFTHEQFRLVVDSILWACKHIERNISDIGLEILYKLICAMERTKVASEFYAAFYISILSDILGLLTDSFHKSGIKAHAAIIAKLVQLVNESVITPQLWTQPNNPLSGEFANNQAYVRAFVTVLLRKAFPNLTAIQVDHFVRGMFTLYKNDESLKVHIRDFLIQIKEFVAQNEANNDELFREEQLLREAEEKKRLENIPGLIYVPPQQNQNHAPIDES